MNSQKSKKDFFSRGLYVESLRRLRLPALILLLITVAVGVLVPLTQVTEDMSYSRPTAVTPTHISAMHANPLLLIMIFVTAPVLTYTLFSFLNRRNASDMYSSMPHSRLSQYSSRIVALVTAYAATVIVSTAVSALMLTVFSSHFVVSWSSFPPYMLGCFVGACLVSAVMCIAMSITGTLLNNIIVTGLIMFMPRFILLFISLGVMYACPTISSTHGFWATSLHNNIITGFFDYLINYYNGGKLALLETVPQLYSLTLAVLYFVIGAVLFCKRQSESAERAAPSEWLRGVYRVILTMAVCTPACLLMFLSAHDSRFDVGIITYIWLYVAALIVFVIYELITTKKWKSLRRALPSLGVVIILNAALLGTMQLCYSVEASFVPSAEHVQYISIIPESSGTVRYFSEYAKAATGDVKITDSDAISAVCSALEHSSERRRELDYSSYYSFANSYSCVTVKLKVGFSSKYREIYFSDSEMQTLQAAIAENESFKSTYLSLPKAEPGGIFTDLTSDSYDSDRLREAYELFRDEVAALKFEDWYDYLQKTYTSSFANFKISFNGSYFYIPVSTELTPKTAEALIGLRNSSCTISPSSAVRAMELYDVGDDDSFQLNYATYRMPGDTDGAWISSADTKLLAECIDTDAELDLSRDFIALNIIVPTKHDADGLVTEYDEFILYVPAVEDARERLIDAGLIDADTDPYEDIEITYKYSN